jgi:hypothetical protein
MWENIADYEYFEGVSITRDSGQIGILRRLLTHPDIADRPHSFDALLVRSGLALALVSREEDFLEAEPLARACRDRWAELFGEDDPMVRRMELIESAAAVNRFLAQRQWGELAEPQEISVARARLTAAAAQIPDRDNEGPLPKLVRAQLDKLASLAPETSETEAEAAEGP